MVYAKRIFLCISFMLSINSMYAQKQLLFSQNEIDSLGQYFVPLYRSDSVQISAIKDIKLLNIYFFNGNCSFCLSKLKKIDSFFIDNTQDDLKTIFIVEVSDTIRFNFHRDKYEILSPIVWDKNHIIKKKHITERENICLLVDSIGRIIMSGDFESDKKVRTKYLREINKR